MRERYLEAFDAIRIDCLNGDKYKTGKVAPDGTPDPSIFSTEGDPVGIQVGTAIATLVRKAGHAPAGEVGFRHPLGTGEGQGTAGDSGNGAGCALRRDRAGLATWPSLRPDGGERRLVHLAGTPRFVPGVVSGSPDPSGLLSLSTLTLSGSGNGSRNYFNPDVSHEEIARRYPGAMKSSSGFVVRDARAVRDALLSRGAPIDTRFVRHAYRPFDDRWLYWEPGHGLLGRPVPDYRPHVFDGNLWLTAAQHLRRGAAEPQACFTKHLGSLHLIERTALMFPAWLVEESVEDGGENVHRANLSGAAQRYLEGNYTDDLTSTPQPLILSINESGEGSWRRSHLAEVSAAD